MTELQLPAVTSASNPYTAAVLDFLADEGFRPSIDKDGDVAFRYLGATYYVMTQTGDATSFAVVAPYFWALENAAERQRAFEAAMQAQMAVRIGRITVLDDNVNASVNAYLPDEQSFKAVLLRSVDGLHFLCAKFREQMTGLLEN
jgi:hypothetical protein